MKKYKEFVDTYKCKRITSIKCNMCSKKIENDINLGSEGLEFEILFQFQHKRDGKMHKFDLCEKCYDKLIKSFKIKVTEENSTFL